VNHPDETEYGEEIKGLSCPECGGALVHARGNAYCDHCAAYVPVVGAIETMEQYYGDEEYR
jgi:uncharacterized Zn finger protein (UPF0148 family)